jgi:hypothetical protein
MPPRTGWLAIRHIGPGTRTSPIRPGPGQAQVMNVKILQVAVLMLPMSSRGDTLSAGTGC